MKNGLLSIKHIIFYGLVFILFLVFALGELLFPGERDDYSAEVSTFDANWCHVLPDGSRDAIKVPGKYETAYGDVLVIEGTVPDYVTDGRYMAFRSSQQTAYIYVDNELRCVYDTSESRFAGRNSCSGYVFCELRATDRGKDIRIELTTYSNFSGLINEIYYGNEMDIWYMITARNFLEIIIATFMLCVGIISIVVATVMKYRYRKPQPLGNLGWIILLSSLISVSESQIRQLLFRNASVVADCTYMLVPTLLASIILFLDSVQESRYHKVYMVIFTGALLNVPAVWLLVGFGLMEMYNSLAITISLLVIALIVTSVIIILEIKSGRIKRYKNTAIGILIFVFCAVTGHVIVNIIDILESVGIFLCVGLLILLAACINETITEIRNTREKQRAAEYAQRAKEEFFAGISHEIRTPLNGVLGMNEMIIRENTNPQIDVYARKIASSGYMMLALVNDLLDTSKIEAGKLVINEQLYSVKDMLSDAILPLRTLALEKGLEFKYSVDEKIPGNVIGDEIRIKQIITNLLSNAVKYTSDGSVEISVSGQIQNNKCNFRISVKDTGIGIKSEDMPYLYDSFARFDEKNNKHIEGTGLGLGITKKILEIMNGRMEVSSEYGKGSEFVAIFVQKIQEYLPMGCFSLDVSSETGEDTAAGNNNENNTVNNTNNNINKEAGTDSKSDEDTSIKDCSSKSVLVVDDNEMNLFVMEQLLKQYNMNVSLASSGSKAVEICLTENFDLIFMDHLMPGMDGLQAMQLIRENKPNQKIIVLTANEYAGIRDEYRQKGFTDYLPKPVNPSDLDRAIKEYI